MKAVLITALLLGLALAGAPAATATSVGVAADTPDDDEGTRCVGLLCDLVNLVCYTATKRYCVR